MAIYVPSTATTFAKVLVKSMTLDDVRVAVCDSVVKIMWMAAPWRWTLGDLPVVTPVANTQDYTFTKPADFLFIERSYIWDGKQINDLSVEGLLPTDATAVGPTKKICYLNDGADKLRLYPTPGTFVGTRRLITQYKKTYTPITSGNIGSAGALIFPDEWTWVFEEGVLWKAYSYADDARAGSAQVVDGKIQYTGQCGIFFAGLEEMRRAEKPHLIYPGVPQMRG
jgi:hypothetical protein